MLARTNFANDPAVGIAVGLEGYWAYYQRAEEIYQELINRYPGEVVEALACGWQIEILTGKEMEKTWLDSLLELPDVE